MSLLCESCRGPAPFELQKRVAQCARCDGSVRAPGAALTPKRCPLLPKGIVIESSEPGLFEEGYRIPAVREGAPLVISRRWFRPQHLVFLVVALGWNALVAWWYAVAVVREVPSPLFAAPLLLVAVGVGVTYYAAVLLLNRTRVRVGDGKLEIRHGPVPWRAGVEVETERLRRIGLGRRCTRGRGDTVSSSWDVQLALDTSESISLVRRIPTREQAECIGRAIAAHLHLTDVPPSRSVQGRGDGGFEHA